MNHNSNLYSSGKGASLLWASLGLWDHTLTVHKCLQEGQFSAEYSLVCRAIPDLNQSND